MRVFLRRRADASGEPGPGPAAAQNPGAPAQAGRAGQGAANGAAGGTANGAASPAERASVTAAKGRPTPKRSEAERRRRSPVTAPADRKAAYKQTRGRDKEARARKYAAMRRGEEWALAPKDKGPVRALARDYVDSRRRISEYYMYGLGVLVVMLTEGSFIGRQIVKLAKERFPGEPTRGVKLYAGLRAMQIRRLRMPAPRVTPGDSY